MDAKPDHIGQRTENRASIPTASQPRAATPRDIAAYFRPAQNDQR